MTTSAYNIEFKDGTVKTIEGISDMDINAE
jgi:hypothetical protein